MARTWLVTGSSSGFGRAVTEAALNKGDNVIATLRKPSDLDVLVASTSSERLLVLKCDVAIESDILEAFAQGLSKFGTIDIVFNNAGIGLLAEVESTPNDAASKVFSVNFWGAANVSREAVRVFREVNGKDKGGWLFNVSSACGIMSFPLMPYYCASKYALEGFTASFAQELDPSWNIKVTLLELGGFKTSQETNLVVLPAIPAYADEKLPSQVMRRAFSDLPGMIQGDIAKAAQRVLEVSQLKDVKDAEIPLHWALANDCLDIVVPKLRGLVEELEKFGKWSDNLLLGDEYRPLVL